MPLLDSTDFKPNFIFRSGHGGTLIPHLFNQRKLSQFKRQRLTTPDHDFLDVDKIINQNDTLALLCHGLEGSSASNYIHNMSSLLIENNFDVIAMNYRGCSGEPNLNLRMYHSGATDDIDFVLKQSCENYQNVVLIGYSLGANMVIKYAGETSLSKPINLKSIVGISAPCDLDACSAIISKKSNYIYEKRFLISLINKIKNKAKRFASDVDLRYLKQIKTIRDFDEYYTGPIHGFKDAREYYELNSSNGFLDTINIPTLIINAANDPFLDHTVFPIQSAKQSNYLHLIVSKYGGHVGFMDGRSSYNWADRQALKFINEIIT